MFFKTKNWNNYQNKNFFKIGPLMIRLDYVILFLYYFYPFDLVR